MGLFLPAIGHIYVHFCNIFDQFDYVHKTVPDHNIATGLLWKSVECYSKNEVDRNWQNKLLFIFLYVNHVDVWGFGVIKQ